MLEWKKRLIMLMQFTIQSQPNCNPMQGSGNKLSFCIVKVQFGNHRQNLAADGTENSLLLGCNDKAVKFSHHPTQPKTYPIGLHSGHVSCDNKHLLFRYSFVAS